MNGSDKGWIVGLGIAALWIWCRDLGWLPQSDSTLPILISFAWYGWLVSPWQRTDSPHPLSMPLLTIAALLVVAGTISNLTLLLAFAWAIALYTWIHSRFELSTRNKASRLVLLTVMAFPWMALDGDVVSTLFRISAAQVSETIFSVIGFTVERSGTNLWIQGLPVTVNEACSGLGVLQAAMIAGVVLLEAIVPKNNHFWMQIPLLILTAWSANVLRVITISIAALTWGTEFAAGPFHTWGGMGILLVVFGLSWGLIEWQQKRHTA